MNLIRHYGIVVCRKDVRKVVFHPKSQKDCVLVSIPSEAQVSGQQGLVHNNAILVQSEKDWKNMDSSYGCKVYKIGERKKNTRIRFRVSSGLQRLPLSYRNKGFNSYIR